MRPLLVLLGALACGCALAPWSELSGRAGASPGLDVAGTVIVGLNGQLLLERRETWNVPPGRHVVLVMTTRTRPKALATSHELELVVEPCTRYVIVARHANGLDPTDWSPEVLRSEPIGGCTPR